MADDNDDTVEYEETTETSENGTTKTTRTPKTSENKDSQDGETAKELPKVAAAAGDQRLESDKFAADQRLDPEPVSSVDKPVIHRQVAAEQRTEAPPRKSKPKPEPEPKSSD